MLVAREKVEASIERGDAVYGLSTAVGVLKRVSLADQAAAYSKAVLRTHRVAQVREKRKYPFRNRSVLSLSLSLSLCPRLSLFLRLCLSVSLSLSFLISLPSRVPPSPKTSFEAQWFVYSTRMPKDRQEFGLCSLSVSSLLSTAERHRQ
jgi:hypothetical protein